MCYDVSCEINFQELYDYLPGLYFDEDMDEDFGRIDHLQGVVLFPNYPIIFMNREDFRSHCRLMEWGIIRYYEKTEPLAADRNKMLNIRSEKILDDTNSYWHKIRNRRCLIPVSGIYEHRAIKGWKKKVPYWIRPARQPIFFLPGLYSVAELPDKRTGEIRKRWTFGLITREANTLMKMIHNDGENRYRMPLFLQAETAREFLAESLSKDEPLYRSILQYEYPAAGLEYHPVWTIRTSKPRPDHQLTKSAYFAWENLPELGTQMPD